MMMDSLVKHLLPVLEVIAQGCLIWLATSANGYMTFIQVYHQQHRRLKIIPDLHEARHIYGRAVIISRADWQNFERLTENHLRRHRIPSDSELLVTTRRTNEQQNTKKNTDCVSTNLLLRHRCGSQN